MPSFLYDLVLRVTGDISSGQKALADMAASTTAAGAAAEATSGRYDKLSGSHRTLSDAAKVTTNAARDTAKAVEDGGKAAEGAAKGMKDAEKGSKDAATAGKGLADAFKAVSQFGDGVGKVLFALGAGGSKDAREGLGGVAGAAENVTTGFSAFVPVGSRAGSLLPMLAGAGSALIPILIGIGVALSPLIAALLSFTVALAGALSVFAIGFGGLAVGIGLFTVLAARTGEVAKPLAALQKAWQGVADTLGKSFAPLAAQVIGWLTQWAAPIERIGLSAERYLGGVLPEVLRMASVLVNDLLNAFEKLGSAFEKVAGNVLSNRGAFEGLFQTVLTVGVNAVSGLFNNLVKLSNWFFSTLPTFQPLISTVFGGLGTVLMDVIKWVGKLGLGFAQVFNAVEGKQSTLAPLTKALTDLGIPANKAAVFLLDVRTAFNDLKQDAQPVIKVVEDFGKAFLKTFMQSYSGSGLQKAIDAIQQNLPAFLVQLDQFGKTIGSVAGEIASSDLFGTVVKAAPDILKALTQALKDGNGPLKTLGDWLKQHYQLLVDVGLAFVAFKVAMAGISAGMKAYEIGAKAVQIALRAWTIAQAALNLVMEMNPIGLIIIGIAALIVIIVLVVTHWKTVHGWITQVWNLMKGFGAYIAGAFASLFSALGTLVHDVLQRIHDAFQNLFDTLGTLIHDGLQKIEDAWNAALTWVRNLVSGWWDWVKNLFSTAYDWVHNLAVGFWNREKQGWQDIFDWVKNTATTFWTDVKNLFNDALQTLEDWFTARFDTWRSLFTTVFDDIRGLVNTWVSDVETFFGNLLSNLGDTLGKIGSSIGDGIQKGLISGVQLIDNFINTINDLLSKVGAPTLGFIGTLKPGTGVNNVAPVVTAFAEGGLVTKPTLGLVGEAGPELIVPLRGMGMGAGPDLMAGETSGTGSATSGLLSWVGKIGGQCLQWLGTVLNGWGRGIPAARDLVGQVNAKSPGIGEIFVSTMGQYGHTGIVIGPNEVIDSNWVAPLTVGTHPLSSIPDIVGYITGVAVPGISGAASAAGGLLGALLSGPESSLKGLIGKIPGVAGSIMQGVVGSFFNALNSLSFGNSSSSTAGSDGSPTNTPGNVAQWLTTALQDTGKPLSWLNDLEIIAKYESSDNPNANQGISGPGNALGLMQTVAGTFQQYMLPGHGNIFNPIDNAIAAIRYISSVYGNPANTPGVKSVLSGGPYHGYATGGIALTPQVATLAEKGPELVSPLNGPQSLSQALQELQAVNQRQADLLEQIAGRRPTVNSYTARLRHG